MKNRLFIALLFLYTAAHVAGEVLPARYAYVTCVGAAVNNNAKHTLSTVFRPSEVARRSAFKPSSRFWFFLRHQKEQRNLGAGASQSVALVTLPQSDSNEKEAKPQSGINFILYNNSMQAVEENTSVLLVEDRINEIQTLATDNLIMQEAGFLEIYVNNDAQTPVYYDNFTVAATTSNVVEVNAYYSYKIIRVIFGHV